MKTSSLHYPRWQQNLLSVNNRGKCALRLVNSTFWAINQLHTTTVPDERKSNNNNNNNKNNNNLFSFLVFFHFISTVEKREIEKESFDENIMTTTTTKSIKQVVEPFVSTRFPLFFSLRLDLRVNTRFQYFHFHIFTMCMESHGK